MVAVAREDAERGVDELSLPGLPAIGVTRYGKSRPAGFTAAKATRSPLYVASFTACCSERCRPSRRPRANSGPSRLRISCA